VRLDELRQRPELAEMRLLQKGTRLSIIPVTKKEFEEFKTIFKENR
jgi:predicted RNA-binding protein with PUA-like domain